MHSNHIPITLEQLAKENTRRVDVVCPGFASDCLEPLETPEEIAIEAINTYIEAGGQEFHYIPCLNEHDDWVEALAILQELIYKAG